MNIPSRLRQKLINHYQSTHSIDIAGKRTGIGKVLARRILVEAGIALDGLKLHYKHVRKLPDYMALRAEYEAGASLNELATKYGAGMKTVHEALKSVGSNMRPRGNNVKILTSEQKARIIELYRGLGSQAAVAAEMGLGQQQVSRCLRGAGIFDGKKATGERHRSWKGGRVKSGKYIAVLLPPEDPMRCMAQTIGYVMEHRLVMARSIGRPLDKLETVHHINGDTKDNRLENLQLRTGRHGKGVVHRCRECGSTNIESVRFTEVQQGE